MKSTTRLSLINQQAEKTYRKKLSNIVFMGMGEPLLNYKNLLKGYRQDHFGRRTEYESTPNHGFHCGRGENDPSAGR